MGKLASPLLARNFDAEKANQKWGSDVTECSLFWQKISRSHLLELCSRDIVRYTIYDHPLLNMGTEMLEKAFNQMPNATALILHFDQGWHYQRKW